MALLAERVWIKTHDRGPYIFTSEKPPFRGNVLVGDRTDVLLKARILTSGPLKEIRIQCDDGCGRWFPYLHDYSTMPSRGWTMPGSWASWKT